MIKKKDKSEPELISTWSLRTQLTLGSAVRLNDFEIDVGQAGEITRVLGPKWSGTDALERGFSVENGRQGDLAWSSIAPAAVMDILRMASLEIENAERIQNDSGCVHRCDLSAKLKGLIRPAEVALGGGAYWPRKLARTRGLR